MLSPSSAVFWKRNAVEYVDKLCRKEAGHSEKYLKSKNIEEEITLSNAWWIFLEDEISRLERTLDIPGERDNSFATITVK